MKRLIFVFFLFSIFNFPFSTLSAQQIESWVTKADRSALFQRDTLTIEFSVTNRRGGGLPIIVDDRQEFQSIDGFGFSLTGGSAEHLMRMDRRERAKILREMFSPEGVGFSYVRLTLGASDLNSFVFSYNDLPEGETDVRMEKFSLSQDLHDVVPVMREILELYPDMLIMSSPWSAPTWMKTAYDVRGGKLRPEFYDAYALYFVKYVEAMRREGIRIDAVTVQNEPVNSKNTPSMTWFAAEQRDFIKNHLGPAFEKAGLGDVKIVLFDHNLDRPDFPLAVLADPEAAKYVDGSGFHLYVGDVSAMTQVHNARPDKNIYFTEQMTVERPGSPDIAIAASVKRLIVDITRNWSRNVVLWNVAADPLNDPHTDNGGCSMCQGAITIDGNHVTRNIAYYVIAHASKFARPGSVRIQSNTRGDAVMALYPDEQRPDVYRAVQMEDQQTLPNVAFRTMDGKIVLVVVNDTWNQTGFTIRWNGLSAPVRLAPGSVGTYIWEL